MMMSDLNKKQLDYDKIFQFMMNKNNMDEEEQKKMAEE